MDWEEVAGWTPSPNQDLQNNARNGGYPLSL